MTPHDKIMRNRLQQLGELVIDGEDSDDCENEVRAWISLDGGWLLTPDYSGAGSVTRAVEYLYEELTSGKAFLTSQNVAVWWDASLQNWATSPNGPPDWPTPSTDCADIRARLDFLVGHRYDELEIADLSRLLTNVQQLIMQCRIK